jgi:hypothetical protein
MERTDDSTMLAMLGAPAFEHDMVGTVVADAELGFARILYLHVRRMSIIF